MIPVVNQINSGIHVFVTHSTVGRNIGLPLRRIVAKKVVDRAGPNIFAHHRRMAGRAHQAEAENCVCAELGRGRCDGRAFHCCPGTRAQRQRQPASREVGAITAAARKEFDLWLALATVRLEGKRQLAIDGIGRSDLRVQGNRDRDRAQDRGNDYPPRIPRWHPFPPPAAFTLPGICLGAAGKRTQRHPDIAGQCTTGTEIIV